MFADSGGWFAHLVAEDGSRATAHHLFARALRERWSPVTTNVVVIETYALWINRALDGRRVRRDARRHGRNVPSGVSHPRGHRSRQEVTPLRATGGQCAQEAPESDERPFECATPGHGTTRRARESRRYAPEHARLGRRCLEHGRESEAYGRASTRLARESDGLATVSNRLATVTRGLVSVSRQKASESDELASEPMKHTTANARKATENDRFVTGSDSMRTGRVHKLSNSTGQVDFLPYRAEWATGTRVSI